ncbi:MAG: tetratricopeptide repeat protein, partial [Candidatus Jordarchaeaceae archaeon]
MGAIETTKSAADYNDSGAKWLRKGSYARAMDDFDQAIKLDPTYTQAYYNRGCVFYIKEDLGKALADFD